MSGSCDSCPLLTAAPHFWDLFVPLSCASFHCLYGCFLPGAAFAAGGGSCCGAAGSVVLADIASPPICCTIFSGDRTQFLLRATRPSIPCCCRALISAGLLLHVLPGFWLHICVSRSCAERGEGLPLYACAVLVLVIAAFCTCLALGLTVTIPGGMLLRCTRLSGQVCSSALPWLRRLTSLVRVLQT